jgi:hypothetical protein
MAEPVYSLDCDGASVRRFESDCDRRAGASAEYRFIVNECLALRLESAHEEFQG